MTYEDYLKAWLSGIQVEVAWWKEWFETRGGEWPDDYARRTSPNPPFALDGLVHGAVKVLDVGAGPISPVGIVSSQGTVELQACDALAPFYDRMLRRHGITPYVRTRFALLERLTDMFPVDHFDVVHMSNALDHTFNPLLGLHQMLDVARLGGLVYLTHFENEGDRTGYIALHQWNMTERNGEFVVWNRDHEYNVSRMFRDSLKVRVERIDNTFPNRITAVMEKIKPVSTPDRSQLGQYDALLLHHAACAFGTEDIA